MTRAHDITGADAIALLNSTDAAGIAEGITFPEDDYNPMSRVYAPNRVAADRGSWARQYRANRLAYRERQNAHAAEQVDADPPAYLCEQCGHYFRPLVPPRACPRCGNAARAATLADQVRAALEDREGPYTTAAVHFADAADDTYSARLSGAWGGTNVRGSIRRLLGAAAVAALLVLPVMASAATPGQVIATIAPGGNIRAVLAATDDLGWPHAPTTQERRAVTRLVLASVVGRRAGAVRCYFGASMGASYCGVNVAHRSQPPRAGRTDRFRVDVKVWEDGSYAILYPLTRAGGR